MKRTVHAILAAAFGAFLLWVGMTFGVAYERHYVNMWRGTALDCIDEWAECKTVCEEGVKL